MVCGIGKERCVFACALSLILFASFLLFFWEETQEKITSSKFQLSKYSKTYEPWVRSSVPIYVQYYFFNWTNPTDLKNPSYKPQLNEVGPYKFWEKIEKVNVTWNENGTVTYRRRRKWYFDPKGSNGNLTDKITTINVIALMASSMVNSMPSFDRFTVSVFITGTQKIMVTKTVSEFLFEGYLDPLLTAGRGWPTTSSKVPYDRFGWFYKRNGSSTFDGVYNVYTGKTGMNRFGEVAMWNFKNQTAFYQGTCGDVKGSGGEYWPWKRRKDTDIYLFSPDLCRYIQYRYAEDVRISDVNGFKYVAESNLFDNGTFDVTSQCFCNGQCLPSGVLNISVCRYGAPVFTSYPHFYQADPVYLSSVVGMRPEKHLHENYVALEPTYGIPLEIAARIQINVLVQPNRYVALLNGVQQLVFPMFWLDQRVLVPSERLTEIRLLLYLPSCMFALSIAFLILGVTFLFVLAYRKVIYKLRVIGINNRGKRKSANETKYSKWPVLGRAAIGGEKCPKHPSIKSIKSLDTDC